MLLMFARLPNEKYPYRILKNNFFKSKPMYEFKAMEYLFHVVLTSQCVNKIEDSHPLFCLVHLQVNG
jgi:hypothetical protein